MPNAVEQFFGGVVRFALSIGVVLVFVVGVLVLIRWMVGELPWWVLALAAGAFLFWVDRVDRKRRRQSR